MSKEALHVLIIGVGSIGERHLRCLQAIGSVDLSICECNSSRRVDIQERYGIACAVGDLREGISLAPDAAVVCTPANTHIAVALQLAQNGISYLLEKPLSVDLVGVAELVNKSRSPSLFSGVAYVYRHHPALRDMRRELQEGRFGTPLHLFSAAGQHFPTYRPNYAETYYAHHDSGGGAVQDALTHILNIGEWLLGPVTSVAADAAHRFLQTVAVEDTVNVLARHQDVLATYSLNQYQTPNEWQLNLVCEYATLRFSLHENTWQWMARSETPWEVCQYPPLSRDALFIHQARAFLDAVALGSAFPSTLGSATDTLRTQLAVLEAARLKKWVDVSSNL